MPVANCPKCGKVFQKTLNSLCPGCHQSAIGQTGLVCQFLQGHPRRTLQEIASGCSVPIQDVETMLYSGKLGSVAHLIIFHCQSCSQLIPAMGANGRFCLNCAQKLENKGERKLLVPKKEAVSSPVSIAASAGASGKPSPVPPSALSLPPQGKIPPTPVEPKAESVSSRADTYGFTRYSEK